MNLSDEHFMNVVSLLSSLIGMFIWLWYAYKQKSRWETAVAPASYLLHCAVFNIAYLAHIVTNIHFLNFWSGIVRLHGIFLFVGLGLLVAGRSVGWIQHQ